MGGRRDGCGYLPPPPLLRKVLITSARASRPCGFALIQAMSLQMTGLVARATAASTSLPEWEPGKL